MSEQRKIQAVAFDLDGLMINTEEVFHLTGTELLRRRGKIATRELFHAMMGRRTREAFQAMIDMMSLTDSIDDLSAESEIIFEEFLEVHLTTMPGLYELLDAIEASGVPKAVATSSNRVYLTRMLKRFDLLDRFDDLLSGDDISHGKPHPEIYLTAASKLGVDPAHMLVMEDSENGTRAAVAAGAYVVSVPHDHSRHHDFRGAQGVATALNDPIIMNLFQPHA
ncbi:HAD family hydrolase [Planctomicrobium sp. SH661]|uniref:HAD family hydrolase n=1 Tax=Planctomicrobium sp. SH661 TaxID=3448124 RepID=UPI003F5BC9D7